MADSKRLSVGGTKGAAPKSGASKGPTATGPGEIDYNQVVGARCKVTTSTPTLTVEGTIFTVCPLTNILAISTSTITNTTGSKAADYRIIPISRIQNFSIFPTKSGKPGAGQASTASAAFENAQPSIARIDLKALKAREAAGIKRIKEKDASRGKGVTKEAQDIFDGLQRTLPTRWDAQNIVVNDAVIISPPYSASECKAGKGQQQALERVKVVLADVRKKLALKPADEKVAVPALPAAVPKAEAKSSVARSATATSSMIATPLPRKGG